MFRSDKNIYAQIIDDATGRTLAAASTLDKDIKASVKNGATAEAAIAVGKLIAERGVKAGVAEVIFDRGAYLYHGRRQGPGRCRPRRRPAVLIAQRKRQ